MSSRFAPSASASRSVRLAAQLRQQVQHLAVHARLKTEALVQRQAHLLDLGLAVPEPHALFGHGLGHDAHPKVEEALAVDRAG